MPEILNRDDVVKWKALEVMEYVNQTREEINKVLAIVQVFPIVFLDKTLFKYEKGIKDSMLMKVRNELFRLLREAGWTINYKNDGFELS